MDVLTDEELRETLVKYNKSNEKYWDESDIEEAVESLSELIENLNEPKDLKAINEYAYEYLSTAGTRRCLFQVPGRTERLVIRYIEDIELYALILVSESQHAAVPMASLYDDQRKVFRFAIGQFDIFQELWNGAR